MTNERKLVVSEPVARKLKKLGFPQDTFFQWVGGEVWDRGTISEYQTSSTPAESTWLAAYTATELGPYLQKAEKQMKGKVMNDKVVKHLVGIAEFKDEANNRAKLLIYLVENKYITV